MKAVYDVISGDAGQKRDRDRFRSPFHKDARLIPSEKSRKTGVIGAHAYTGEEYITGSSPLMEKEGFYEKELARRFCSRKFARPDAKRCAARPRILTSKCRLTRRFTRCWEFQSRSILCRRFICCIYIFALPYFAIFTFLFVQALRGQPLFQR